MNQRALSNIGEPVLIEDAMSYWELLQDNEALRAQHAEMLAALKAIFDGKSRYNATFPHNIAYFAIQKIEGC